MGSRSAVPYPPGWEGVTVTGFRVLAPSLLAGGAVVLEPRDWAWLAQNQTSWERRSWDSS